MGGVQLWLGPNNSYTNSLSTLSALIEKNPVLQNDELSEKLAIWETASTEERKEINYRHNYSIGDSVKVEISLASGQLFLYKLSIDQELMTSRILEASKAWAIPPDQSITVQQSKYATAKFSADGSALLIGKDSTLELVDLKTFEVIRKIKYVGEAYAGVALIKNSSTAAFIHYSTASIINLEDESIVSKFEADSSSDRLRLLPDGSAILVQDDDKIALRKFTGEVIRKLDTAEGAKIVGQISPDSNRVLISPEHRKYAIYDFNTGKKISDIEAIEHENPVASKTIESPAFSANGKIMASYAFISGIIFWDVDTGAKITTIKKTAHDSIVDAAHDSIALSPDGSILVCASSIGFTSWLEVYDVESGEKLAELGRFMASPAEIAFSPDGQMLAVPMGSDDQVHIWKLSSILN
ncbi:MAG: hypothetical protein PF495_00085 [Spirochaetales bacterium]|nr:hypothetical protein [Spirochaetales bacterium]